MEQRYHQKVILPFIPNPFAFVEVSDNRVRWKHGLNERFALDIKTIQTKLDAPGILGQLFGAGDVVFVDGGVEYRVPGIVRGRALKNCVHASQAAAASRTPTPATGGLGGSRYEDSESRQFPWALPSEVLRAYGRDWQVCVYTGRLIEKDCGTAGNICRFLDIVGREKLIRIGPDGMPGRAEVNQQKARVYESLRVGDWMTMAYLESEGGYGGNYFLLFDHTRQDEFDFCDTAIPDLAHCARWSQLLVSPASFFGSHGFHGNAQHSRVRAHVCSLKVAG